VREHRLVSEQLRKRALVSANGDLCGRGADIEAAPKEITDARPGRFGLDIYERLSDGTLKDYGASGFQMEHQGRERVLMSLALAVRDVRDTKRLTGFEPPFMEL
ncbi:MAG: hypothetical protein WBE83_02600, partial [Candidatus Cybelea sp.]